MTPITGLYTCSYLLTSGPLQKIGQISLRRRYYLRMQLLIS